MVGNSPFFEGDAFDADFDVSGWTDVSIPHTWNAKDAEDEIPGYFGEKAGTGKP